MTKALADRRAGSRERIAAIGDRLVSPMPADRLWGWVGPLAVTAFAAILRFSRLSVPHAVNYDETDYVKDAWSILRHGAEWNPVANPAGYPPGQSYADNLLLSGGTHIFAPCSGYSCGEAVTHPEVGKYLIAIGEWVFGLNPFGYRVASAVFGSLAILLMCRIARRLTRSTLEGLARPMSSWVRTSPNSKSVAADGADAANAQAGARGRLGRRERERRGDGVKVLDPANVPERKSFPGP